MSRGTLPPQAQLRQRSPHLCAECNEFEVTLSIPPGGGTAERLFLCERCADRDDRWRYADDCAPAPGSASFLWVDTEFFQRCWPLLRSAERSVYLAIVYLVDNRTERPNVQGKDVAAAAGCALRNVRAPLRVLADAGLIVRLERSGPLGTRYLLVRPHVTSRSRGAPSTVLRADVYARAAERLPVIHSSPVTGRQPGATGDPTCTSPVTVGSPVPVIESSPVAAPLLLSPSVPPPSIPDGAPEASPVPGNGKGRRDGNLIVREAVTGAAELWPDYSEAKIAEQVARVYDWAKRARLQVTAAHIVDFFRDGARGSTAGNAEAIWRSYDAGGSNAVNSPLHVWIVPHRWKRWIRKRLLLDARSRERKRAAHVRELPQADRLEIARSLTPEGAAFLKQAGVKL